MEKYIVEYLDPKTGIWLTAYKSNSIMNCIKSLKLLRAKDIDGTVRFNETDKLIKHNTGRYANV